MQSGLFSLRAFAVSTCVVGLFVAACSVPSSSHDDPVGANRAALSAPLFVGASLPPKTLALTFDDGPGDFASGLSTYLKDQGIRAAFFVNGARVATSTLPNPNGLGLTNNAPAILKQIVADGHLVANHTVTHRDMVQEVLPQGANQLLRELQETDNDIRDDVPSHHFLFRPPYGSWNDSVYADLKNTAMNKYVGPIYWDIGGASGNYPNSAADWACWGGQLGAAAGGAANGTGYATTQQCGDAYLNEIASVGHGIVLMHDPYSWGANNTFEMIKYMIPKLKEQGYSFVRVDEVPTIAAALPCDAGCRTCAKLDATVCTSCSAGAFLNNGTCSTCANCGAGTFQSAACTATTDTACSTCATCAAGTYVAAACGTTKDTVCSACDATCVTCTGAGPNQCATCAAGSFLSANACHACTTCAPGTFQASACSATKDTVCSACDPSCVTCTGPGANQCGSCPVGTFLSANACQACTTCAAGTFQSKACTPAEDTECTACAAGTFSGSPGATTCEVCVNDCNDSDACTKDTCDAVKGCVHAPIEHCVVDAGSTTDSGAEEGDAGSDPVDAGHSSHDASVTPSADASSNAGVASSDGDGGGCNTSGRGRDGHGKSDGWVVALGLASASWLRRRGAGRRRSAHAPASGS